ncbi:hypothetical protein L2E82_00396 [Cichorium intybus]|uniref:Uncharacterized protein n=1 Tax=Cichorium intybus TaxID=13427 RepID=A0ACB9GWG6_CICIN|nr:hypothetical protein L2E82_00396 [Cichorium intybus]
MVLSVKFPCHVSPIEDTWSPFSPPTILIHHHCYSPSSLLHTPANSRKSQLVQEDRSSKLKPLNKRLFESVPVPSLATPFNFFHFCGRWFEFSFTLIWVYQVWIFKMSLAAQLHCLTGKLVEYQIRIEVSLLWILPAFFRNGFIYHTCSEGNTKLHFTGRAKHDPQKPTSHREDEVVFTNLRERKLKREKVELEEEPERTFSTHNICVHKSTYQINTCILGMHNLGSD